MRRGVAQSAVLTGALVALGAACLDFTTTDKRFRCDDACADGGAAGGAGGGTAAGGGAASRWDGGARQFTPADAGAGAAVAFSRNGSTFAVSSLAGPGTVWVYAFDGLDWALQGTLVADNAESGDAFGVALSLSDDGAVLAVGAPLEDGSGSGNNPPRTEGVGNSGAVYVFAREGSSWAQTTYLKAFTSRADERFGAAVSLAGSGDALAVGAPGASSAAGIVWVVRRLNHAASWGTLQDVVAQPAAERDGFGESVALSSDATVLTVGAPGQADGGAAYVFISLPPSWGQQARLVPASRQAGAQLGMTLTTSSNGAALIFGAPLHDLGAGAVFSSARSFNVWSTPERFDPGPSPRGFGTSLALSGDGKLLLVGAATARDGGSGEVAVLAGGDGAWVTGAPVVSPEPAAADGFGAAVAVSGDGRRLVVGAPGARGGAGAVWLMSR